MAKRRSAARAFRTSSGRTTIVLETEFWDMLEKIARSEGKTATEVLGDIEQSRGKVNRASAIRVYVLQSLCQRGALGLAASEASRVLPEQAMPNPIIEPVKPQLWLGHA